MLTVQEIQALTFEKAMFNGYDPKSVDEVIEQITEDYAEGECRAQGQDEGAGRQDR